MLQTLKSTITSKMNANAQFQKKIDYYETCDFCDCGIGCVKMPSSVFFSHV